MFDTISLRESQRDVVLVAVAIAIVVVVAHSWSHSQLQRQRQMMMMLLMVKVTHWLAMAPCALCVSLKADVARRRDRWENERMREEDNNHWRLRLNATTSEFATMAHCSLSAVDLPTPSRTTAQYTDAQAYSWGREAAEAVSTVAAYPNLAAAVSRTAGAMSGMLGEEHRARAPSTTFQHSHDWSVSLQNEREKEKGKFEAPMKRFSLCTLYDGTCYSYLLHSDCALEEDRETCKEIDWAVVTISSEKDWTTHWQQTYDTECSLWPPMSPDQHWLSLISLEWWKGKSNPQMNMLHTISRQQDKSFCKRKWAI